MTEKDPSQENSQNWIDEVGVPNWRDLVRLLLADTRWFIATAGMFTLLDQLLFNGWLIVIFPPLAISAMVIARLRGVQ